LRKPPCFCSRNHIYVPAFCLSISDTAET
jgi:hypothetical protein